MHCVESVAMPRPLRVQFAGASASYVSHLLRTTSEAPQGTKRGSYYRQCILSHAISTLGWSSASSPAFEVVVAWRSVVPVVDPRVIQRALFVKGTPIRTLGQSMVSRFVSAFAPMGCLAPWDTRHRNPAGCWRFYPTGLAPWDTRHRNPAECWRLYPMGLAPWDTRHRNPVGCRRFLSHGTDRWFGGCD